MWILDASVAVKWFFTDEKNHKDSLEVLSSVVERPTDFAVPELFYSELAAVFVRKSGCEASFVKNAIRTIYQLGTPTIPHGAELVEIAINTCCHFRISFYDGLYVSVAKMLGGHWLTADEKAVKRLGPKLAVSLEDFKR